MDAFYAAVEVLVDPSLAGKPLIVGGDGERGVVASCSYEARSYGIHSAMPSVRARRLCPPGVFVPGRYDLYQEHSRRLHEVLLSFSPLVEGIALDEAFLDVTGARRLWGEGPATRRRLDRFGIRTVGDLAAMPLATLVGALGEAHGRHLHALAWARDDRAVEPDRAAKSVGHEETYARDHYEVASLRAEALRLADGVANRLREAGLAGRTVTLKVRFASFETITRSRTVPVPVDAGPAIARVAVELLEAVDTSPGVRLLGVSVSNLSPRPAEQLQLGEGPAEPAVARAVEEVRSRFGDAAVGPAALLRAEGLSVKRRGDQQWGPGRA